MLVHEIKNLLAKNPPGSAKFSVEYEKRLEEGALTIQENPKSHFTAFFVPYNSDSKKVLIGDHKRSGLWLFPGGHIDEGETLLETLNREIHEELGVESFFDRLPDPFYFSMIDCVKTEGQECVTHYDIWFLMEADGVDFKIDPREYYETKWVSLDEARRLNNRPEKLEAIKVIEKMGRKQI